MRVRRATANDAAGMLAIYGLVFKRCATSIEDIGVFREVGFKYDTWHDVAWLQRRV